MMDIKPGDYLHHGNCDEWRGECSGAERGNDGNDNELRGGIF